MSKFKVGDRVAVYGTNRVASEEFHRKTGTITCIEMNWANVDIDGGGQSCTFHLKQLRRLIKKPRQRIWVVKSLRDFSIPGHGTIVSSTPRDDFREFVEVKKK